MSERWSPGRAAEWLRRPGPRDHKYTRGLLGISTGSARYPGAAVLGVSAAWRTGIGMVRYAPAHDEDPPYGLPSPAAAVLAARPETVFGEGRCDAWLIGSGTDPAHRAPAEEAALLELLRGDRPVVVDAGALDLVPRLERGYAPLILTPHAGEFDRLWESAGLEPLPDSSAGASVPRRAELARRLAAALRSTVLLKSSTSVCATPGGRTLVHGPATPWLASAGTGDVLAGIIGALVAGHATAVRADPELLGELGATAALLHDSAARIAAADPSGTGTGRPASALDIAEAIPAAWAGIATASA
ncbi:ADP-dependent NAD(P)H-hydrate dehydratase [Leucobacter celer]|uniref:ADP-dependent NAD(P)H-hydrate dehydratase n=1 Tax=Leucobacter celer TaxID=668625 RepID=UPI0006A777B3|nr:ADP/ATP-dependent (S)-NAD(P)H-hydrate dehydratase [Leucobacter celer]